MHRDELSQLDLLLSQILVFYSIYKEVWSVITLLRLGFHEFGFFIFSNLVNAGIYVLEPEVLARIPSDRVYDFGHDLFPAMLAEAIPLAGYDIEDHLIDIGLPEKYEEANQIALTVTIDPQGT